MGSRRSRSLPILLLLSCAACSSSTAQTSRADGGAPAGFTKIDDMEQGDGTIEWAPPAGLAPGNWYSATDCSTARDIWPPGATANAGILTLSSWSSSPLTTPHETFPGIVSTRAARVHTISPILGGWGASMDVALATAPALSVEIVPTGGPDAGAAGFDASPGPPAGCPIVLGAEASSDLSAYAGITFWAQGDPTGARTVRVIFLDANTDPRGGICNYVDSNSPDYCYNGFSTTIALTGAFTRYTVDFASLAQTPTWGYHPNPDVFDVQHVYQLLFQIDAPRCYLHEMCVGGAPPPLSFDFWIDDLYFVNK
ncbi:MAG TPA: hypothetical protein VHO67_01465 [Polyangia bacterium]|nr:hypothetical protein [Polyangia bacterium]